MAITFWVLPKPQSGASLKSFPFPKKHSSEKNFQIELFYTQYKI
ncbi:11879_t:CDS:2, partial [Funneliformis geosporum]